VTRSAFLGLKAAASLPQRLRAPIDCIAIRKAAINRRLFPHARYEVLLRRSTRS
jgi:hypothetical protein